MNEQRPQDNLFENVRNQNGGKMNNRSIARTAGIAGLGRSAESQCRACQKCAGGAAEYSAGVCHFQFSLP